MFIKCSWCKVVHPPCKRIQMAGDYCGHQLAQRLVLKAAAYQKECAMHYQELHRHSCIIMGNPIGASECCLRHVS